MALPKQIELWTDLRIVIRNYTEDDIGEHWADVGVQIHSLDYDEDIEKSESMVFVEKEMLPDFIKALQEFVE